jgi:murein peptide amidase A
MSRRQAGVLIAMALVVMMLGEEAPAAPYRESLGRAQVTEEMPITIGHSVQGRPIVATELGDPNATRTALVVGVIHGDERAGLRITQRLRDQFSEISGVKLWVIDSVNPDGQRADRRTNAHRVDLNRNFPYRWHSGRHNGYYPGTGPLSEPESRAVVDFIEQIQPQLSVWYHQPWNAVLRPCHGPSPIQRRYSRLAHMKLSCRGADLPGTAINWQNHTFPGTTAIVVELPPHAPRRLVRSNAEAAATLAAD